MPVRREPAARKRTRSPAGVLADVLARACSRRLYRRGVSSARTFGFGSGSGWIWHGWLGL